MSATDVENPYAVSLDERITREHNQKVERARFIYKVARDKFEDLEFEEAPKEVVDRAFKHKEHMRYLYRKERRLKEVVSAHMNLIQVANWHTAVAANPDKPGTSWGMSEVEWAEHEVRHARTRLAKAQKALAETIGDIEKYF